MTLFSLYRIKILLNLIELVTAQFTLCLIWFSDNLLALNTTKTIFMLLALKSLAANCPNVLHFDVHNIVKVNVVIYLGLVIIDCDLAWKQHAQCINNKLLKVSP